MSQTPRGQHKKSNHDLATEEWCLLRGCGLLWAPVGCLVPSPQVTGGLRPPGPATHPWPRPANRWPEVGRTEPKRVGSFHELDRDLEGPNRLGSHGSVDQPTIPGPPKKPYKPSKTWWLLGKNTTWFLYVNTFFLMVLRANGTHPRCPSAFFDTHCNPEGNDHFSSHYILTNGEQLADDQP